MTKRNRPYGNCVAYAADDETSVSNHHYVKTIYFIKPDLSSKDGTAEDERDFRVDKHGNFKSSCNGLYPIKKSKTEARAIVSKIAEQLQKHKKSQARKSNFKRKNKTALARIRAQSNEAHSDDEAQQIRKAFVKKAMAKRDRAAKKATKIMYYL